MTPQLHVLINSQHEQHVLAHSQHVVRRTPQQRTSGMLLAASVNPVLL
jgi:hypothetical protein